MMNILLVQPDEELAKTYQQYLVAKGHEVINCGSAEEAISTCDEKSIDVIVLELLLGEHNGIEFLYEFRSYIDWQELPIILLTALPPHELKVYQRSLEQLNVAMCLYRPSTTLEQLDRAIQQTKVASKA